MAIDLTALMIHPFTHSQAAIKKTTRTPPINVMILRYNGVCISIPMLTLVNARDAVTLDCGTDSASVFLAYRCNSDANAE
jgi:hypothetical protein